MSELIITDEIYTGMCMSLWNPSLDCPNRATWHLMNTTNHGEAFMCDSHKEGFARAFPTADVRYERLEP